jgi:osmotically inducible lipoprotein OsmB
MRTALMLILATALLVGCGTVQSDRALSGAAIGAGIGLVGGPPGVVVGGVVGAGVGMISSPRQIDLGRPFWKG